MPRLLLIFLVILSCSFAVTRNSSVQFKDLDENHWAAKSIYNCVRLGITKGYPDGTFRGERQVNRYELMVFLNNLAISLEKIIDEKLENAMFAGESETNNRALEELKTEIEVLREQILSNSTDGAGGTFGLKKGPSIHGTYEAYGGTHVVKGISTFWENQYLHRFSLFVSGNIGSETGYLAGVDTDFLSWGPNNYTKLTDDVLEGKFYTSKAINNDVTLKFALTKGPGEIKMADKKITSRMDDAIILGSDTWGLKTNLKFAVLGTTNNFDINGDGTFDTLQVNEFSPSVYYTIPMQIPYLGFWTIGFTMNQITTEKSRIANDLLRTTRYIQTNTFEITDKVTWQTKHIKEVTYTPTLNEDSDTIHDQSQGIYYDTAIIFGDIFNSGTNWELVYAYRGNKFGGQGLLEPPAGINIFGYETCAYFMDDWENQNRMPSASIVTEGGARITQNLYNEKLFLNLLYLKGTAIPDPDKELPNGDTDSTKYYYSLAGIGINWLINDNFNFYINCEQKKLDDSTIEDNGDQYSDTFTYLGLGCKF